MALTGNSSLPVLYLLLTTNKIIFANMQLIVYSVCINKLTRVKDVYEFSCRTFGERRKETR